MKNKLDEIIAGIAVSMAIEDKALDAHLKERLRQFLNPTPKEEKGNEVLSAAVSE